MSKHTPGPWRYQEGSDPYTHIVRAGETGLGRFVVQCGQSRNGSEEANARLIAAAPEMLEALRPLANYLAILETMGGPSGGKGMNGDDHLWHVSSSAGDAVITFGDLQRARAAIAKAEGRS